MAVVHLEGHASACEPNALAEDLFEARAGNNPFPNHTASLSRLINKRLLANKQLYCGCDTLPETTVLAQTFAVHLQACLQLVTAVAMNN